MFTIEEEESEEVSGVFDDSGYVMNTSILSGVDIPKLDMSKLNTTRESDKIRNEKKRI
jgi:hypothetical protein